MLSSVIARTVRATLVRISGLAYGWPRRIWRLRKGSRRHSREAAAPECRYTKSSAAIAAPHCVVTLQRADSIQWPHLFWTRKMNSRPKWRSTLPPLQIGRSIQMAYQSTIHFRILLRVDSDQVERATAIGRKTPPGLISVERQILTNSGR